MEQSVAISKIIVAERIRRDYGDLDGLAASIASLGLLQPIVVTEKFELVAGLRRLRAVRDLLQWKTIPARVVSLANILDGERDENEVRKNFTNSERVALKRAIEARIGSRQGQRTDLLPEKSREVDRGTETAEYAAKKAGFESEWTARQAEAVVDAGVPELVEAMDAGMVAPSQAAKISKRPKKDQERIANAILAGDKPTEAMRQVRNQEKAERAEALPKDQFRVIYADPPWSYNDARGAGDHRDSTAARDHYPTMTLEEIKSLPIKVASDAVLFLWATFPLLPEALEVVKSWGFTYKTAFVWDKQRGSFGHYHDCTGELLILATRGSCTPDTDQRERQIQSFKRGRHSAKPDAWREMIDRLYPHGPRIELFRRGAPPDGWTVWGSEAVL